MSVDVAVPSNTKVRWFSREGFSALRDAFRLSKYGPKEWGIWALSSAASDAKYVIGAAGYYLWGLLPTGVSSVIKSVAFKVSAVCIATVEMVFIN